MSDAAALHESERLEALDRYDILDTSPEESFDRITRLVSRMFRVPMSTVTFVDGHRQWFKSRRGISAPETCRGPALCSVAIRQEQPLVIPDTLLDDRFRDNPLVTGAPHLRFYAGAPLRTPDGHSIGTLCAMDTVPHMFEPQDVEALMDIARIVESELELRTLATTDGLTGVLSRRAFREAADRSVALALRHRDDLSCIMLDLDRFKAINDTYGHAVGDAVLVQVAETCRKNLRKSDLLGRLGGEEFAILLPRSGLETAMKIAEKFRAAVARLRIPADSTMIGVTASFGVCALDGSVADADTLFRHADAALYAAKADGRNRCNRWKTVEVVPPSDNRKVFKAGRISFDRGRSTVDCTVRSLSEAGAGMDIFSSAGIPKEFKLQIESDGLHRHCRVVTAADKHLEVAFE